MGVYQPEAIVAWCDACVEEGLVNMMDQATVTLSNVQGMGTFDLITLYFATLVISLHVVSELKGIELCALAIKHADECLDGSRDLGQYGNALLFINGLRRWVFLPTLVATVPILVGFKGGDALSVCMNTVAVLFLTEIDDVLFNYGVGERIRDRAKVAGRVELGPAEEDMLAKTKMSHVVLLFFAVVMAVKQMEVAKDGYLVGTSLQFGAFWVGGLLEQWYDTDISTMQKFSGMASVTLYCGGGFIVFGYLLQYSGHTMGSA